MTAAAALAALIAAAAPGVDETEFRYTRELATRPAPLLAFEPDAALVAHTRRGFADLRIVDADGRQVPWRRAPRPGVTGPEQVPLLNAGRRGRAFVALVDLGPRRRVITQVTLDVPERDFVGGVRVEASDDRRRWTRLASSTIYDIRGTTRRVRSTVVTFPPTDLRYLRLRATGIRRIAGLEVQSTGEPRLAAWPGRQLRVAADPTRIVVDLRFSVPLAAVAVASPARRFNRLVVVEIADDRRDWREINRVRIFKLPDATPEPVQADGRARYVRVTIVNGDDPPLPGPSVEVLRRRQTLLVQGGRPLPLRLLYGNARVRAPSYEFARLPVERRARRPALLRPERLNDAYEPPPDTRSFAARHPVVVTAALVIAALAVAAAGGLALRRRT